MDKLIFSAITAFVLLTGYSTVYSSNSNQLVKKHITADPQAMNVDKSSSFSMHYENETFLIDSVESVQKKEGIALSFHIKMKQTDNGYQCIISKDAKITLQTNKGEYEKPLRAWPNAERSEVTNSLFFTGATGDLKAFTIQGVQITDTNGNIPIGYQSPYVPIHLEFKPGCIPCKLKK